jgi:transcriptional regulator with XRE-family HTH domain
VPAAAWTTTLVKSLSELLQAANTDGLSARSIARQAQALGYSLNHDTAARYLRGDHGRPDEDTLLALASVLKLPLAPLRKAAQLPSEVTEPYRPPPEASRLSRRQRRAVDEIIRAMLESGRTATSDSDSSKAARRGDAEPPAR